MRMRMRMRMRMPPRVSNKRQFLPQQSIYVSIIKTPRRKGRLPEQTQAKKAVWMRKARPIHPLNTPFAPLPQISVKFGHWLPKSRSFFNHLGRQPYTHV